MFSFLCKLFFVKVSFNVKVKWLNISLHSSLTPFIRVNKRTFRWECDVNYYQSFFIHSLYQRFYITDTRALWASNGCTKQARPGRRWTGRRCRFESWQFRLQTVFFYGCCCLMKQTMSLCHVMLFSDVCLPAVFMPTRTGHVYSPKAHSYFHPPGKKTVSGWWIKLIYSFVCFVLLGGFKLMKLTFYSYHPSFVFSSQFGH